jgi:hypothetical protein
MTDPRGNPRVLPPSGDDQSLREFGRQLAMDSLLGMAFDKGGGGTWHWAAGSVLRRASRLMQGPWRKAAALAAAVAASLVLGVVWWNWSRPGVAAPDPKVARQESADPRPIRDPEPRPKISPPEPQVVPFSAASAKVEDGVPPKMARGLSDPTMVDLLSRHETLAVFEGLDSGERATFGIKKYLNYERPSPYGDAKQKTFTALLGDYDGRSSRGDGQILKTVRGLRKGDYVLLTWEHRQITTGGVSSPDRLIVKLERVDKDKAESLLRTRK